MSDITTVITLNDQGERIRAQVYRDSPDGSGRLDLLIPTANSQTNAVTFVKRDKFTVGKDCALPGQDSSFLGAAEREAFEHKTADESTQVVDDGTNQVNTQPLGNAAPGGEQGHKKHRRG